eukprot:m.197934 g.197934  ORF g.197934 m.197934 type:complete len:321 (+) comp10649_c1_seq1:70-1032(+)
MFRCVVREGNVDGEKNETFGLVRVVVVGAIVHDQLAIDKVKAVGAHLVRGLDNLLDLFLGECGKLVDVLARVDAVRHAEAKVKVKSLEKAVLEKVALNHAKVLDGLRAHLKLDRGANRREAEKVGRQLVAHKARRIVAVLRGSLIAIIRLANLKERRVGLHVAELEASKVDAVDIVRQLAEVACAGLGEAADIVRRDGAVLGQQLLFRCLCSSFGLHEAADAPALCRHFRCCGLASGCCERINAVHPSAPSNKQPAARRSTGTTQGPKQKHPPSSRAVRCARDAPPFEISHWEKPKRHCGTSPAPPVTPHSAQGQHAASG